MIFELFSELQKSPKELQDQAPKPAIVAPAHQPENAPSLESLQFEGQPVALVNQARQEELPASWPGQEPNQESNGHAAQPQLQTQSYTQDQLRQFKSISSGFGKRGSSVTAGRQLRSFVLEQDQDGNYTNLDATVPLCADYFHHLVSELDQLKKAPFQQEYGPEKKHAERLLLALSDAGLDPSSMRRIGLAITQEICLYQFDAQNIAIDKQGIWAGTHRWNDFRAQEVQRVGELIDTVAVCTGLSAVECKDIQRGVILWAIDSSQGISDERVAQQRLGVAKLYAARRGLFTADSSCEVMKGIGPELQKHFDGKASSIASYPKTVSAVHDAIVASVPSDSAKIVIPPALAANPILKN